MSVSQSSFLNSVRKISIQIRLLMRRLPFDVCGVTLADTSDFLLPRRLTLIGPVELASASSLDLPFFCVNTIITSDLITFSSITNY